MTSQKKNRYRVLVKETRLYRVEVEGADSVVAGDAAIAIVAKTKPAPTQISMSFEHAVAIGEPWATSRGWYDLHGPDNIVVVERSRGNRFSAEDISLLHERITKFGLKVVDSWNGVGCDTVSFQCTGRRGGDDMSKDDLAALLAPRPGVTDT